jgi:small subunit ribosomal protein S6
VRKYEFIFILDPGVDDAAVNDSLERYAKVIRDHGGEVSHQEVWGRRKFAYDINKKSEGSYLYIRMRAASKTIEELNRALHFDERVLRNLIVLDEDAEARNLAARRERPERGERGERGDRDRYDSDVPAGAESRAGM